MQGEREMETAKNNSSSFSLQHTYIFGHTDYSGTYFRVDMHEIALLLSSEMKQIALYIYFINKINFF